MRIGALVALLCVAACRTRPLGRIAQQSDSVDLAQLLPHESTDSALVVPRVITAPSVVLFWLRAADTLSRDDQAATFDDLKYYTAQVAPALAAGGVEPPRAASAWHSGRADVTVRDGRSRAVANPGSADEGGGTRRTDSPPQVRDCRGWLVMPGLIQAHVHLCQALFRGLADDLRLEDWLARRIWPLEAAHTEATVYASALLGAAELLLGGTTAILAMETVRHTDAAFRALE